LWGKKEGGRGEGKGGRGEGKGGKEKKEFCTQLQNCESERSQ
jgi:hypothetical protein